jgi:hypothetical protein
MDDFTIAEWGEIEAQIGGRLEALQEIRWGGNLSESATKDLDGAIALLAPIVDKLRQRVRNG